MARETQYEYYMQTNKKLSDVEGLPRPVNDRSLVPGAGLSVGGWNGCNNKTLIYANIRLHPYRKRSPSNISIVSLARNKNTFYPILIHSAPFLKF